MLSYEQDSASLDNGGRILDSVVRPYPAKTCGIPVRFEYEMLTGEFTYEWVVPSQGKATEESGAPSNKLPSTSSPPLHGHPHITAYETEVFVPSSITHGRKILVQGVEAPTSYTYDESRQTLFIVTKDQTPGKRYRIHVSLNPPLRPAFDLNDLWTDYGSRIIFVLVVLLGFFFYRF